MASWPKQTSLQTSKRPHLRVTSCRRDQILLRPPPAGSNARKVRSCETQLPIGGKMSSQLPSSHHLRVRPSIHQIQRQDRHLLPEIVASVVLPGPSPVQVKNDPGSAFALWYCGQFQHPAGSTQKVRLFEYHQEQLQQSCFEDKCIHMFLVSDLNCTKIGCPKGLFLRLPHFRNQLAIYAIRTRVAFRSPQVASMYFHIYYRNYINSPATLGCHAADVGE